jgi:hypothetical protein
MEGIFIVREIGQKIPPIRFAVMVEGAQYRIVSYFPVARDSSIAVHSYFPSTHTFAKRIDKPVDELDSSEQILSINQAEKEAFPFFAHKTTFHQSGIQNLKDRRGERLQEHNDIQSIPFDNIKESIRLCYFYPTLYRHYPKVFLADNKHHNVFDLVGAVTRMPSIIEIRLCRKGYDFTQRLQESYPGFAAFIDRWTLEAKGLDIFTTFRKSPNPKFPSTHALIKEFY